MKTDACSVRNGILSIRHHAGAICALSLVVLLGLAGCRAGGALLSQSWGGGGHYQDVENQPGCAIWNKHPPKDGHTVSWSGECVDGKASGEGVDTRRYRVDGEWHTSRSEGSYVEGKREGHWDMRLQDVRWEGSYDNGLAQGRWVGRYDDGRVSEGFYVADKLKGAMTDKFTEGSALEGRICRIGEEGYACWMAVENRPGCYYWNSNLRSSEANSLWSGDCADGKPDGKGVLSWRFRKNGKLLTNTDEGVFVDGKRSGHWIVRFHGDHDMRLQEGPYVDGKRNGV